MLEHPSKSLHLSVGYARSQHAVSVDGLCPSRLRSPGPGKLARRWGVSLWDIMLEKCLFEAGCRARIGGIYVEDF